MKRVLISREKTMSSIGRTAAPCGKHFSKRNLALLNALWYGDKRHRFAIARTADKPLVRCICECALNVLQGVVKLSDSEKARVRKHKLTLRKLIRAGDRGTCKSKKRVIVQNGGSFLMLLLTPIVGTLLSKIFGSKHGESA